MIRTPADSNSPEMRHRRRLTQPLITPRLEAIDDLLLLALDRHRCRFELIGGHPKYGNGRLTIASERIRLSETAPYIAVSVQRRASTDWPAPTCAFSEQGGP
jgi:hypothetical protein